MRNIIIRKAMEKYGASVNRNINKALKLYLENDATDEERENTPLNISINTPPEIISLRKILETRRPTCEECGAELHMQLKIIDNDGIEYPTGWFCVCGRIEYSNKTAKEWLEILSENR
jgi:hypothetical protein